MSGTGQAARKAARIVGGALAVIAERVEGDPGAATAFELPVLLLRDAVACLTEDLDDMASQTAVGEAGAPSSVVGDTPSPSVPNPLGAGVAGGTTQDPRCACSPSNEGRGGGVPPATPAGDRQAVAGARRQDACWVAVAWVDGRLVAVGPLPLADAEAVLHMLAGDMWLVGRVGVATLTGRDQYEAAPEQPSGSCP